VAGSARSLVMRYPTSTVLLPFFVTVRRARRPGPVRTVEVAGIAVHVVGMIGVTQGALPLLRKSANPVVVNITSVLGSLRAVSAPGSPLAHVRRRLRREQGRGLDAHPPVRARRAGGQVQRGRPRRRRAGPLAAYGLKAWGQVCMTGAWLSCCPLAPAEAGAADPEADRGPERNSVPQITAPAAKMIAVIQKPVV
jgi:hypothetical protein